MKFTLLILAAIVTYGGFSAQAEAKSGSILVVYSSLNDDPDDDSRAIGTLVMGVALPLRVVGCDKILFSGDGNVVGCSRKGVVTPIGILAEESMHVDGDTGPDYSARELKLRPGVSAEISIPAPTEKDKNPDRILTINF